MFKEHLFFYKQSPYQRIAFFNESDGSYSLTLDDMKLLKNQELFEIRKSEELQSQRLTPTSKENTLEVTIVSKRRGAWAPFGV